MPDRLLLLAVAIAVGWCGPCSAQGSPPLSFTVRPSGVESAAERQARLLRRFDEAQFHFRSICRQCGRKDEDDLRPFRPIDTLNRIAPQE